MDVEELMKHKQELRFNLIKAVRNFEETTGFHVGNIHVDHSGVNPVTYTYSIKLEVTLGNMRNKHSHCWQPQCCL
uniref:Uncharacterized protein n=1 Tax=viral metagenome TaxID=1070528 RepID=A0A6M3IW32_9ZZZZ